MFTSFSQVGASDVGQSTLHTFPELSALFGYIKYKQWENPGHLGHSAKVGMQRGKHLMNAT